MDADLEALEREIMMMDDEPGMAEKTPKPPAKQGKTNKTRWKCLSSTT